MTPATPMKLGDYFQKCTLSTVRVRRTAVGAPDAGESFQWFNRMLASAISTRPRAAEPAFHRFRISDYLANPIRSKRSQSVADNSRAQEHQQPVKPASGPSEPMLGPAHFKQESEHELESAPPPSTRSTESFQSNRDLETPVGEGSVRAKIKQTIRRAAQKYGLPANLIQAVIQAESDFRVGAISPAGAQGLMQLMPETAKELGVDSPLDIDQNIDGGSRYLRRMLDLFEGDVEHALAAYNAGPGAVRRFKGVPPYRETRRYIQKVLDFKSRLG